MLETARLRLRPLTLDDLDGLAALHADPEVMTFTGGQKTRLKTAERLTQLIALYAQQGFGMFAVDEKASGRLIGRAGFLVQTVESAKLVELAYGFAKASWGHGFATEACVAARDWGFEHLPEPRMVSLIDPRNQRSLRVAERIGSRFERDVTFHGQRVRLYVNERAAPDPRS